MKFNMNSKLRNFWAISSISEGKIDKLIKTNESEII